MTNPINNQKLQFKKHNEIPFYTHQLVKIKTFANIIFCKQLIIPAVSAALLLGIYPKEIFVFVYQETFIRLFIAAVSVFIKTRDHPNVSPLENGQINSGVIIEWSTRHQVFCASVRAMCHGIPNLYPIDLCPM